MSQQFTLMAKPTTSTPQSQPESKYIFPTLFYRQNNSQIKFNKCIKKCNHKCEYNKLVEKNKYIIILSNILLFFIIVYLVNSIFSGFRLFNNDTINLNSIDIIRFIRIQLSKTDIYINDEDKE